MRRAGPILLLPVLVVTLGCATVETDRRGQARGTSGVVTWEVSDVGRVMSADNQRVRWSYLITLRNTSDRAIQLERVERAMFTQHSDVVGGAPTSQPFRRRLAARSELKIPESDNWGWRRGSNTAFGGAATLGIFTAFRRFSGVDDGGAPIDVAVRVRLDSSSGALARPPTMPQGLPGARTLAEGDLATLVGVWRGSYRMDGGLFDVPIAATIRPDGAFEIAENEPVTNRFRRLVTVKDGGLDYSGGRDRGVLAFHEGGGRRILTGRVVDPGDSSSTASSPVQYAIYLEQWASTRGSPTSAAATSPVTNAVTLSPAIATAFAAYRTDLKYTAFKAFAMDNATGAWGRAWGLPSAFKAMERALDECRKRSSGCEVYAVGDTVLATVSAEQREALVLGGATLTYAGTLTVEQDGRVETSPASFYVFRGMSEITGSWSREHPLIAGVITGGVSDTNRAAVRMTQMEPCRTEFTGQVSIGAGGTTLSASYAGTGCEGASLTATFTGVRK